MTYRPYTGVGSRQTPAQPLQQMRDIAKFLANNNYILRSGAAPGADMAFEAGCDAVKGAKQIFLPWKGFNGNRSQLFNIPEKAFDIADEIYGPALKRMKYSVRCLMARNVQQVLGPDLKQPSVFLVCWTQDGATTRGQRSAQTGGTGQAIALADTLNVPVFNLKRNFAVQELAEFLGVEHEHITRNL